MAPAKSDTANAKSEAAKSSPTKPRKSNASGDETKARIIDAALATLSSEGIVGASARTIAKTGDFNQALIFYHFGSLDDLIVAAVGRMSTRRMDTHRAQLEQATSLPDLIRIARALHHDDTENDHMTVLAQAFAGASGDSTMGPKLYQQLEPWSEMVAESIERVLGNSADTIPHRQIADAISAMFLGIELMDSLDPAKQHATQLFDTLQSLAELLDDLLATPLLEMMLGDRS